MTAAASGVSAQLGVHTELGQAGFGPKTFSVVSLMHARLRKEADLKTATCDNWPQLYVM